MNTTGIKSLEDIKSLPTEVKDGSCRLSANHLAWDQLQEILVSVSPRVWKWMILYFPGPYEKMEDFSILLRPASFLESFSIKCKHSGSEPKAIVPTNLSKWTTRTGAFDVLCSMQLSHLRFEVRSLKCFCVGLKTINSLRQVYLERCCFPEAATFFLKEAISERRHVLSQLRVHGEISKTNDRSLKEGVEIFFLISDVVKYRLASYRLMLRFDEMSLESFKLIQTAASLTPTSSDEVDNLILVLGPSVLPFSKNYFLEPDRNVDFKIY